ncbi:hypothetical protein EON63_20020 [archaeon]|nr:MAG: hypothetical protein EON63_20020 [archaeon]
MYIHRTHIPCKLPYTYTFAFFQAPTVMRSVSQSLNLATTAVGTFLLIPLIYMVNSHKCKWFVY